MTYRYVVKQDLYIYLKNLMNIFVDETDLKRRIHLSGRPGAARAWQADPQHFHSLSCSHLSY